MSCENPLEDLFGCNAQKILIYRAVETVTDPFEKTVEKVMLNPLPIPAIVNDLTATQALYKIPGVKVARIKEIYIEKKHRNLIESSHRIEVDGNLYQGWRSFGKLQIREEGDYLRLYIYSE